jgi:hypothetical protein
MCKGFCHRRQCSHRLECPLFASAPPAPRLVPPTPPTPPLTLAPHQIHKFVDLLPMYNGEYCRLVPTMPGLLSEHNFELRVIVIN